MTKSPAALPPGGRGKEGPITAPFVVLVDIREKRPYRFGGLRTDAKEGARPIEVPMQPGFLINGDYSIVGMEERLGIERKSKSDLFASVARRANFEDRLERMTEIRERLGWRETHFAVMVEAETEEIRTDPPRYSKLAVKSLNRTIIAWRQRYPVDWWFVAGREAAQAYTYRILERFWKDHSED